MPLVSPAGVSRFVTGALGMGHIVLGHSAEPSIPARLASLCQESSPALRLWGRLWR